MVLKYAIEIFHSEEEALKEIKIAIKLWRDTAKKEGRKIPEPQSKPILIGFSRKVRWLLPFLRKF